VPHLINSAQANSGKPKPYPLKDTGTTSSISRSRAQKESHDSLVYREEEERDINVMNSKYLDKNRLTYFTASI
jgi:hypothetical protein